MPNAWAQSEHHKRKSNPAQPWLRVSCATRRRGDHCARIDIAFPDMWRSTAAQQRSQQKKPCHAWVPIADHDQDAAGRHPPSSSEFRNFKPEMLSASVSSENTTAYRIVQDGAGWCNMQGTWMASWCIMSLSFLGDGRAHSCGRPQLEEFVDVSPESESRVNPLLFCAVLDVLGICRIWW